MNKIFNTTLLLFAPFIAITHTLLAIHTTPEVVSAITFFSFLAIIAGMIISFRQKRKTIAIIGTLSLLLTSIIYVYDISTKLILGEEVAYNYTAEVPGYTEVRLYERGKATISFGGIMGITDTFYSNYSIEGDTVIVLTKDSTISIINTSIKLENSTYCLQLKSEK